MRFLALDLATTTGWAINQPHGPDVGIIDLSKLDGIGERLIDFEKRLTQLVWELSPDRVCFEAPLHPSRIKSILHARSIYALCGETEKICKLNGIRCVEVPVTEHKKVFVGNGNAKKEQIMAECRRRGWNPPNQDAADALSVLSYLMKVYLGIERYAHAA